MTPRHRIAAVLFDLDGVLVDTFDVHLAAYRGAFEERSLSFSDAAIECVAQGAPREAVLQVAQVPAEWREAVIARKGELVQDRIRAGALEALPGVIGVLNDAAAHPDVKLGVVSNSRMASSVLRAAGLDTFFIVVIDGNAPCPHKPDPAPYRMGADELRVPIKNCLVVEDTEDGARSGRRAGARVVGVSASRYLPSAEFRFARISDIPLSRWIREGLPSA